MYLLGKVIIICISLSPESPKAIYSNPSRSLSYLELKAELVVIVVTYNFLKNVRSLCNIVNAVVE